MIASKLLLLLPLALSLLSLLLVGSWGPREVAALSLAQSRRISLGLIAGDGVGGGATVSASSAFAFRVGFEALRMPGFNNSYQFFLATAAGVVKIGEPAQHFKFLVDTGSDYPWVYSRTCYDAQVCSHPRRYDHSASATYVRQGGSVSASYGAGSWSGFASYDLWNISIVDSPYAWVNLKKFAFAEVTTTRWSGAFAEKDLWDGFLAMTYPKQRLLTSFWTDLIVDGFTSAVAAVDMRSGFASGVFRLGSAPGIARWVPLLAGANGYYWWMVRVDDILVAGKSTGGCSSGCAAMFDTGAGALWMQDSLNGKAPLHDFYDCADVSRLPSVTLVISGVHYTLDGADYALKGPGDVCYNQIIQQNSDTVPQRAHVPAALPTGEVLVHMGAAWFRKYVTALDASRNLVGFS